MIVNDMERGHVRGVQIAHFEAIEEYHCISLLVHGSALGAGGRWFKSNRPDQTIREWSIGFCPLLSTPARFGPM